jgi:hypothetical protein
MAYFCVQSLDRHFENTKAHPRMVCFSAHSLASTMRVCSVFGASLRPLPFQYDHGGVSERSNFVFVLFYLLVK